MALGLVAPEILARRERHVGLGEDAPRESEAVAGERGAIRIDVERPLGHDRHAKAERFQGGDEEAAALIELRSTALEDLDRFGLEAGERRVLRHCRRRDEEVLRQRLDLAH